MDPELDFAVFPAAAAEIDVAEDQEGGCIDVLGAPADCYVCLEDSCYDCAVDGVDSEGCKFEAEGCLGASCAGNRIEKYHGADCEQV